MSQSKYWCFTINNYTVLDEQKIRDLFSLKKVSYYVFGREVGESGTPHLQGYLELPKKTRLTTLKKSLGRHVHLEQRKGSAVQSQEYCQKDGDFEEDGEISVPESGKRNDLVVLQVALNNAVPLQQISQEFFGPFLRYQKSIKEYIALNQPKRSWEVECNVYWGKSRTGKTRRVMDESKEEDLWMYPGKGWFDGYYGQDCVLFDDFYGDMPISLLLKVLDDWYSCSVPTKGGHVNWKPRKIWITSNTDPRDWYNNDNIPADVKEALMNRLKKIIHFN